MDPLDWIYNIPTFMNALAAALLSSFWSLLVILVIVGLTLRVMGWTKPKKKNRSRRRLRKA